MDWSMDERMDGLVGWSTILSLDDVAFVLIIIIIFQ